MSVDLSGSLAGSAEERAAQSARRGVGAWLVVVAVALTWGSVLISPRPEIKVASAPIFGHWGWYLSVWVLLPVAVLPVIVVALRRAEDGPWRRLVITAGVAGAAWAAALGAASGPSRLVDRLTSRYDYLPFAAGIGDGGEFLSTFTERLRDYPIHVKGHPPGATLVPWSLEQLGFHGAGWFQALNVAMWGVGLAVVLLVTREVAGEIWARRAAAGLVLLPAALWATYPDGFLFGVGAAAVGVTVIAVERARVGWGIAGGVLFAAAAMLTYGAVTLAVIPTVIAVVRRRWAPLLAAAAAGAAALVLVWGATGFWWVEGLGATRVEYWRGVASERPSLYFALAGNPGALALAVGPATVAGLASVRHFGARVAILPLAALGAVLVADVSLMSKAEVERIWLLFMPWLAVAISVLPRRWRWLMVQLALAAVLHLLIQGRY